MSQTDRAFQIFTKPVGAACNLRCSYCYYLSRKELYPEEPFPRMKEALLEAYIRQHMEATTGDTVFFSWHGGEPTLAGLAFYRQAVALQKRVLPQGKRVLNGIQTNGTLLDEEWCRFLAAEHFLVGISLDGPGKLHDAHRKTASSQNSFEATMKGFHLLQKYGITTEILCVINALNVNYPLEVYHFFKGLGARYITFLPLVEEVPAPPGNGPFTPEEPFEFPRTKKTSPTSPPVSAASVPPLAFGHFLATIFDEWAEEDIGKVTIQLFEEALRTAFDNEHTLCIFKPECGGVPVVEHNGDFYCCDHFVDPAHRLGNLREHPLSFYLDAPRQKAFGAAKSLTLPRYCRDCPVVGMCNGECPKNRFITTPDGEPGLNYLCEGYQFFFSHCLPLVSALKEMKDEGI